MTWQLDLGPRATPYQEAIKLPIGPITRARAKRFKDAILAMVERVEENDSKEFKNELNIFNFFEAEFRSS